MKIWLAADHHFGHTKIVTDYGRNQFQTIEEHDEYIIKQHNSVVRPNDTVYFLGDVFLGNREYAKMCLSRMSGNKILIIGNHDRWSINAYKELGFETVIRGVCYIPETNGKVIVSHIPVREAYCNPYIINIHGHLHHTVLDEGRYHNYYCVSMEQINYTPVNLDSFIGVYSQLPSRYSKVNDWYKPAT